MPSLSPGCGSCGPSRPGLLHGDRGPGVASPGTVCSTAGPSSQTPENQVEASPWRSEQRVPPACRGTPEPARSVGAPTRVAHHWCSAGSQSSVLDLRVQWRHLWNVFFGGTHEEEQQGALPAHFLTKAGQGFPGGASLERGGFREGSVMGPGPVPPGPLESPDHLGGDKIGRTKSHISCPQRPGGGERPVGAQAGPRTLVGHHACPSLQTHQVPGSVFSSDSLDFHNHLRS